jgi:hypothetical protein
MTHGGDEGCDEGVFNDGFGAGVDRPTLACHRRVKDPLVPRQLLD